jgi:hypothetical protein
VIVHGTVAVYAHEGFAEIAHLCDGNMFGEYEFFLHASQTQAHVRIIVTINPYSHAEQILFLINYVDASVFFALVYELCCGRGVFDIYSTKIRLYENHERK